MTKNEIQKQIDLIADKFESDFAGAESVSKGLETAFDNLDFDNFKQLHEKLSNS